MNPFLVIPSITTISRCASGWQHKIREVEELGLRSVGLFLTGVDEVERRVLYRELELAHVRHLFTIPFVHAVADMSEDEYRYLSDRFGVELFNLHPLKQYPLRHALSAEIRSRITIENASLQHALELRDLEGFRGICLDVAHAEDLRRNNELEFEKLSRLTTQVPVLANHISVSGEISQLDSKGNPTYHSHLIEEGRDLSYLRHYPAHFFSSTVAIELANSLAEQVMLIPSVEHTLAQKFGVVVKRAA